MKIFIADLHLHTCLSPCGEQEMSPKRIVNEAVKKEIDLIAICDHNSTENVPAVVEASLDSDITVLPGIEITSREEVHVTGLFEYYEDLSALQSYIYHNLEGENDSSVFGVQMIVNKDGTEVGFNRRLLIGATNLSIESIVQAIHEKNGLAIAAHIDREGFGILGKLGFIPINLELDALEISPRMNLKDALTTFGEYKHFPFIHSSDAHRLNEIGAVTTSLNMETVSFKELQMTLKGHRGRHIRYEE